MDRTSVLLVEDDEGDAYLLEEMLEDAGDHSVELTHVRTLGAAMETLESSDFHLVLLDLGLPDSQGLETFQRLSGEYGNQPIIVLTGNVDIDTSLWAINMGAQDYLVKGKVDGDLLARAMRYSMERFRLAQQIEISNRELKEDIEKRKKVEEELKFANRKLNLLGSTTRHDVLNEISTMEGYRLLLERMIPDGKASEYIGKMESGLRNIHHLMDFTRDLERMRVEAPKWTRIDSILTGPNSLIDMGEVELRMDLPPLELLVDSIVERVILNVLDNSLRHGGDLSYIHVYWDLEDDRLQLFIEDDGVGIPPERKEHIFEYGYGSGRGLGLFLCREILDSNSISICEEGEEGAGALFVIRVPPERYRWVED
ncbi:MAG: ATP-binding protein [Methanomassiliicoccales archaeon]